MEVLDALLLGIIQGLTEFLPVSSSGHLELGKAILGDQSIPKESLLFTVVLHFATALSTLVIFRKDVIAIIKGALSFTWNADLQFVFKIGISMLPAAFVVYPARLCVRAKERRVGRADVMCPVSISPDSHSSKAYVGGNSAWVFLADVGRRWKMCLADVRTSQPFPGRRTFLN